MLEKLLSRETLTLAVLSATAYFYSYVFELIYVEHFGLSARMVTISTLTILSTFSILLLILMIAFTVADSVLRLHVPPKHKLFMLLALPTGLSLVGAIWAYLHRGGLWLTLACLGPAVASFTVDFGFPFFERKKFGSYTAAVAVHAVQNANEEKRSAFSRIEGRIGKEILWFGFAILVCGPAFVAFSADWVASNQRDFLELDRDKSWLLIVDGQDSLTFSAYDISSNTLTGELLVLRGKEIENVKLRTLKTPMPPKKFDTQP